MNPHPMSFAKIRIAFLVVWSAFTLFSVGACLAQAPDSAKSVTGLAQASLTTTWEAAKKVLASRGDTLLVQDESPVTIMTKPHPLDKAALLSSFTSTTKPEESGYTNGTCELAINLSEKGAEKTFVELKAKIMAYGTPNKGLMRAPAWEQVPSNGKIEREVLKAILGEAKKHK